jgi:glycosyltransferase involved in cell wall biosynthesis
MSELRPIILLKVEGDQVASLELIVGEQSNQIAPKRKAVSQEFSQLIEDYPDAYISWYDIRIEPYIKDVRTWPALLQHPLEVIHLSTTQHCDRMVASLGFVDFDSPFLIPGPKDLRYVTWLISPMCGVGMAHTFKALGYEPVSESFAVSLFDFGQRSARWGLCPYSEPALLKKVVPESVTEILNAPLSLKEIAILVRRLYGRKWLAFWVLAQLLFHRQFPLFAAACVWVLKAPTPIDEIAVNSLHPTLPKALTASPVVDVIVPTLRRPDHALNVLRDLAAQSLLPGKVVLIEQNPDSNFSQLIKNALGEEWPFEISHHTASWLGACRARNIGIRETQAEWVLFLDDDVRLQANFINNLIKIAYTYHVDVVNAAVYQPGEDLERLIPHFYPRIWASLGTCAVIVAGEKLAASGTFDTKMEGGFGEDYEYGIRLRLNGANVLYSAVDPALHLKAPMGGFRFDYPHPWRASQFQPRPSPTVLISRSKFGTRNMQDGYKLYYWLNRLFRVPIYKWFREFSMLRREWASALYWSERLLES